MKALKSRSPLRSGSPARFLRWVQASWSDVVGSAGVGAMCHRARRSIGGEQWCSSVLAGKRKWNFRVTGSGKPAARSPWFLVECRRTAAGQVVFAGWRNSYCFADSGCLFRRARESPRGGWSRFAAVASEVFGAVVARAGVRDWFVWVAAPGV
jgi:hypothetical protein